MSLPFFDQPLAAKDIDWDLAKPCADCPFRKSSPPHEGVATSVVDYVESIEGQRFAHTCHKTDNRMQCDGPRNWQGTTKACAGSVLMLLKTGDGMDLQLPLLEAAEAGKLDLKRMVRLAGEHSDIFTVRELVEFYAEFARRRAEELATDPLVCCVFPEQPTDPPTMVRLSRARREGLDILECLKCGSPAVDYDPHWPYHQSHNFCIEHAENALRRAVDDLELIARDFTREKEGSEPCPP